MSRHDRSFVVGGVRFSGTGACLPRIAIVLLTATPKTAFVATLLSGIVVDSCDHLVVEGVADR
jgi:hypothetical protein